MTIKFALVGASGTIASSHYEAIIENNGELVAVYDVHDAGLQKLDRLFPYVEFYNDIDKFSKFLVENNIDYLSICTPDYAHKEFMELALRSGCHAICEKPLVIYPEDLDELEQLEKETGKNIYAVLQIRYVDDVIKIREKFSKLDKTNKSKVFLKYITHRGPWYWESWRGDPKKAGGLAMDIGIHFMDAMIFSFGKVINQTIELTEYNRMKGKICLEKADVEWLLSVDKSDIPDLEEHPDKLFWRKFIIDGIEVDLSKMFLKLHPKVYREILEGRGLRIPDVRDTLNLTYEMRLKSEWPQAL